MTVYNKLKVAILTIMTTQAVSAITIDPIQVQSGSGDLLYAEMKFSNSNPNEKVEVSLADTDDLISVGASHKAPSHLNFYTRRSGDGTGVIVITSSRPMIDSELNVLLKIKEGNATHLQQVKTALTRNRPKPQMPGMNTTGNEKALLPQMIVSEKDIELNLPTSTRYQSNLPQVATSGNNTSIPSTTAKPLAFSKNGTPPPMAISVVAPPPLNNAVTPSTAQSSSTNSRPTERASSATSPINANAPTRSINITQQSAVVVPVKAPEPLAVEKKVEVSASAVAPKAEKKVEQTTAPKQKPESKPENHVDKKAQAQSAQPKAENPQHAEPAKKPEQHYVVQANESLWKIASRIARETQQSTPEVMRQIKENNANAFIQGDVNRIRRGAALNLSTQNVIKPKTKYQPSNAPLGAKKQSGAAKYRLDQAEMNLVADNEQSSAQGTARKNTQANQTSTELSTKVMTSREKTVKLQKQITQLSSALQQKNQRIQLLNARLAQLQMQLQQKNVQKPKS